MTFETLTTERLTLRPARVDDAQAVFDHYAADPEVTRYLQWRPNREVEGVRAFLQLCEAQHAAGTHFNWVVAETVHGQALGMVSLTMISTIKAELGYVLSRAHWGRGYMPEAARAVISFGLGTLGRFRVHAYTDFENTQSARALQKAGMSFEGRLRRYAVHPNLDSEPRDALMFAACR